jgi:[ribosomal protein S5]-alanine N-acetyltransferase
MKYLLQTQNLVLRPINSKDAHLLWPYVSNPEISKDMSWEPHKDVKETENFISNALNSMEEGKSITWCILLNEVFCGIFSLISILRTHRSLTYNKAELAYWIGQEFQGKGIMTEAGKKVIEFAFTELKLHKLTVGHHRENGKSKNLILRLGFKYSHDEEDAFMKNGQWISCKFYELRSDEYFKTSENE